MGRQTEVSMNRLHHKEVDRQLKEHSIYGLNDTDMLAEIIMELTKVEENTEITSEKVLCRARRVEVKRAKSTIMNSLTDTRGFDNKRSTQIQSEKTISTCKNAHKTHMQLLWIQPSTETMPSLWEEVY